jgi:hypothetical protein
VDELSIPDVEELSLAFELLAFTSRFVIELSVFPLMDRSMFIDCAVSGFAIVESCDGRFIDESVCGIFRSRFLPDESIDGIWLVVSGFTGVVRIDELSLLFAETDELFVFVAVLSAALIGLSVAL